MTKTIAITFLKIRLYFDVQLKLRSQNNYLIKMMEKVNKFFWEFDAFPANPTLRAKKQPQSASLFTGVFSFIMYIAFTYLFIIKLIQVFTYQEINSNQIQEKLLSNQTQHPDMLFALRVSYLSVDKSLIMYSIRYVIVSNLQQVEQGDLVPCTKDQWSLLGQQYEQQFYQSQLNMFFCLPKPIRIQKSFYRDDCTYAKVFVQRCKAPMNCVADSVFANKINGDYVAVINMYFLDGSIRPNQKNPMSYIVNSDPQFSFTLTRSILANVQLASFTITTDYGIWPWQEMQQVKGNYVHSFRDTSFTINSSVQTYAQIYISMNRFHINMDRSVGKVDQMLSYAGGFFSLVVAFFAFFLNSFNQYRYELMVGEGIFHQDEDKNRIKESDLNFFKYIKYSIFDWINSICCCHPEWKDCIIIDNARQQANTQIDVTNLFRKIQVIQSLFSNLMNVQVKDCIALVKPDDLSKVKRARYILQYYDAIVQGRQGQPSLTIEQYRVERLMLQGGLNNLIGNDQDEPKGQGNINQSQDPQQHKIMSQFNYEDLKDQTKAFGILLRNFQKITELSQQIQLDQQLEQIQRDLAQQFFKITPMIRSKIQDRVPIIILIRIYKKREQLIQAQRSQNGQIIRPLSSTSRRPQSTTNRKMRVASPKIYPTNRSQSSRIL